MTGTAMRLQTAWEFLRHSREADVILLDCDPSLTLRLQALYLAFWFLRKPIVALDIVLRPPRTWKSKLIRPVKKFLLSRVDHYIHYFKDLDGYWKYYGIGLGRSSYVAFKSNIKGRLDYTADSDGDYVLCFGRSERDYDTFIKAIASLPLPAAIPVPNFKGLGDHDSRFSTPLSALPTNLLLLQDDGSQASSLGILGKARIVALPIVAGRISPSGIGTYLTAMLLGKCVIITEGPGATDILTDQALFVPAGDPAQLARVIELAWNDRGLRERVAAAGRAYAESCGDVEDLRQRVLDIVVARYGAR